MSSYIEAPQPPGQSADVDAILDATHLAPGSYDATICLHSNDATRRKLPIPVHLTVGAAGDGDIFAEGFDGDMP
jgi:hypothetical protein